MQLQAGQAAHAAFTGLFTVLLRLSVLFVLLWMQGKAWANPTALHQVPDTIAQRVQACTGCHGKEGVASNQGYFPRIAGKPAGYLYNQLINFQQGRRNNATMLNLVDHLSAAYLWEMATYFSALDLPYPAPVRLEVPPAELARGQSLVLQGDASKGLPACVQCHGDKMTGLLPNVPGLLGLPRDYVLAQLGAWQLGQRRAVAPDCMKEISQRLSAPDLAAVASYLAAQAVPADSKAAIASAAKSPLACGSAAR